jgi:hypothetical protein
MSRLKHLDDERLVGMTINPARTCAGLHQPSVHLNPGMLAASPVHALVNPRSSPECREGPKLAQLILHVLPPVLVGAFALAERYGLEPRLLKSPEYRLRDWSFLTAIPRAFFCPTNTSNCLARVIPV